MELATGRVVAGERHAFRHVDLVLVAAALGLAVIGLFAIYSATHQSLAAVHLDPGRFVKRQLTFLAVGAVVLLLAVSFDYRLLKVYAGMIYVSSLVLLVLVRTPFGTSVKGAQRWFELFGFQLAPSEIAKLALIAMLAAFLSELRGDLTLQDVFRTAGLAAVPAFLVFLQPDLGSSIVFAAILVGMLVVAGARARYLAVLALTAVVLIVAGFQVGLVREYQIERLQAFLDPASVSAGRAPQPRAGRDRDRVRRADGRRVPEGIADEPRLRPRAAHGLRVHGRGRGVRVHGVRRPARRCTASCCGERSASRCCHEIRSAPTSRRGSPRCSRCRCSSTSG